MDLGLESQQLILDRFAEQELQIFLLFEFYLRKNSGSKWYQFVSSFNDHKFE